MAVGLTEEWLEVHGGYRECSKVYFRRLDSDQIVHDLLESDPTTIREVEDVFGPKVISNNGGVNRSLLGSIVFGDDEKLQALEDIMHPKVREAWEGAVASNPEANWDFGDPLALRKKTCRIGLILPFACSVIFFSQVERLEQKGMGRAQALAHKSTNAALPKGGECRFCTAQ